MPNFATELIELDMLRRLSDLKAGSKGIIQAFDDSESKIMLMEMGCILGEKVIIENIAPLGDPIAVQIAGYSLSIRKQDAQYIWVHIA